MRKYGTALLMLVLMAAFTVSVHAAEIEWFVEYDHTSDVLRGPPFNNQDERFVDYIGGGVTLALGSKRAWEVDIGHGVKRLDGIGAFESGSKFAVRFYPGRTR